jgi:ribosome-binding factor A
VQILRDISELLEPELPGVVPGMVTFTRVKLSNDLRYAKVYFSYLGEEGNRDRVTEYLNREKKRIRTEVGHKMRIRHIPEIEFRFDPSIEEGIRIEQLLNEIKGEGSKSE